MEAQLAFETTVAEEMRIDGTVDDREREARNEEVFELFPHLFGVGLFAVGGWCVHGCDPVSKGAPLKSCDSMRRKGQKQIPDPQKTRDRG